MNKSQLDMLAGWLMGLATGLMIGLYFLILNF